MRRDVMTCIVVGKTSTVHRTQADRGNVRRRMRDREKDNSVAGAKEANGIHREGRPDVPE